MIERYTWDNTARVYRDRLGNAIPRKKVRTAVDTVTDSAQADIDEASAELQEASAKEEGNDDDGAALILWQSRMELAIKLVCVAAGAIAAGGREQARPEDWAEVSEAIRGQYHYLREFVREIEAGLPLDGKFRSRSGMYGGSGVGTYERVLRRGDWRAGFDEERRLLNSERPCASCSSYAAMGWQPIGSLPDIGESCECMSNCRCSFERRRSSNPSRVLTTRPDMPPRKDLFDKDKCHQRNRVAAVRDEMEGIPLRPINLAVVDSRGDPEVVASRGTLPANDEAALARINAMLGEGAKPLTADRVYIRYLEAGNDNFIGDRYAFLDRSTLINIAKSAADGFAFMNSHRTGGLSSPSELPFGRTFAGRYEMHKDSDGGKFQRTVLGVYMLRGQRPNGANGPSTDDLVGGIDAGTIFDVSLGVFGGERVCDVCGNDVGDAAVCSHVPGSVENMSPEQVQAQLARGVTKGRASYSIVGADANEVSAVFDGAVPGAGFRKARTLAKQGKLGDSQLRECREAFANLIDRDDFQPNASKSSKPSERGHSMKIDFRKAFKFWQAAGEPSEFDMDEFANGGEPEPKPKPSAPSPAENKPQPTEADTRLSKQVAELTEKLAAAEARQVASEKAAKENALRLTFEAIDSDTETFCKSLGTKVVPAEATVLKPLRVLLARIDHQFPELCGDTKVPLSKQLESLYEKRPAHMLGAVISGGPLPTGAHALQNDENGTEKPVTPERRRELLSLTEGGRATLAREDAEAKRK